MEKRIIVGRALEKRLLVMGTLTGTNMGKRLIGYVVPFDHIKIIRKSLNEEN